MKNLPETAVWEKIMKFSLDIICTADRNGCFIYISEACKNILGYESNQLTGYHFNELVHPDDQAISHQVIQEVIKGFKTTNFENRLIHKTGKEVPIRWSAAWSEEDETLFFVGHDATEQINNRQKLQESKQRFKALFEANPEMVLFEDKEGVIRDVNLAVLSYFGVEKHEIINCPLSDFLPSDVVSICEESLQDALKGNQMEFDVEIAFENLGVRIFEVKKIPVEVNHEIIGVYTIVKDVTLTAGSHRIVKQQAKKLNTIFESITDGFFTLDRNWNITYINSEFDRLLHTDREQLLGKSIWEIFPEEVNGEFYKQYHHAVETAKAAHFEAYFEVPDLWLQVKAFPSEEGLSVYFDDITDRVRSKQELEKLSLVASKTINGVAILNAEGRVEWVNDGFTNLTGYTLSEAIGKKPFEFLPGPETDKATIKRISDKVKQAVPFTEEVMVYTKSGDKLWYILDVTPVLDNAGKITNLIAIQTDTTFRKEAEESQLQMANDLYKQNRDLQQFTYIVSHNLRAPVANALGLTDLLTLSSDRNSEQFNIALNYLKTSAHQMDTVLKDLNTILSIRDTAGTIDKEQVKLMPLCRQVIESLQEPLERCGGEVALNIDEDIHVNGNRAYLYSIFHNLLSNAIRYRSPERILEINISYVCRAEKEIMISISDNGIGFDTNKAGDHIFKLYKRFHTHFDGRGFGLFLVKTHLEAMGGHIEVNSKVNVGTTFLLYLK
jgi:PAS domain S-box-containing protein